MRPSLTRDPLDNEEDGIVQLSLMEGDANTALWLNAIHTRSYDNARQLVREDQDVNVRGAGGITALHVLASRYDALKKIQKLLLDGADPHLTDDHGRTPLRIAQIHNRTEVVQHFFYFDELLRALANHLGRAPDQADIAATVRHKRMRHFREDVRRQLEEKSTKLINAARDGDFETVNSVVESAEISIDAVDRITGETAFSAALAAGRRRVCEYLLANDAHLYAPCIVNETSLSVLSAAAAMWDVDFVKRVLSRGAMLTMPTGSEIDMLTCPLAEAAKSGSTQMVDALLELGTHVGPHRQGLSLPWPAYAAFDFSSSNLDDETPWRLLAIACWQQDLTMIEHLFDTQASLRDRSILAKHGAHALFLAVHQENQGIVADLLARGVSVNESIGRDMTALVAAVAVDSLKMLHFLLENGADANVVHTSVQSTTGFAEGLLSTAVYAGAMDCAHELLRMETRPQFFDQALHGAAKRGDVDFARLLLDIALPSTPRALAVTISRTSCPLTLDLLLSRCGELVDFTALNNYFPYACRTYRAGIVSVLIAYGVDINLDNAWEQYPPLLGALMLNNESGVEVAKVLIENGVETILPMRFLYGRTLLSRVEANLRDRTRACQREYYEAGRDLLISHGILQ